MKRVLLLFHDGVEEIEAIVPIDLLRRAGIVVVSASVSSDLNVVGAQHISMRADFLLSQVQNQNFDMLIIPGGPGISKLRNHSEILDLVKRFLIEDKQIAAQCAAPLVLLEAGILARFQITSFPGTEHEFSGHVKAYTQNRVHIDGQIITSRGAGTAEEFSLALIETLMGRETSERVRQQIVARS